MTADLMTTGLMSSTGLLERPVDDRPSLLRQPGVPDPDARLTEQRLSSLFDAWAVISDTDGVLVGIGRIGGVRAIGFATDPTRQGGALGIDSCRAIAHATDRAVERGIPVVGIWHSGGARLREGVGGLHAVAGVFAAQTRASGKVAQISVVLGPAAGGAAYGPALTDVVILGPAGRVFVTGPDVVRSVTGEDVTTDRLGGAETHSKRSGVVHLTADSDTDALGHARRLTDLLGRQGEVDQDDRYEGADLRSLVPTQLRKAYDMRKVVTGLLDPGSAIELHPAWGANALTVLGRLGGRTVGVVANNPLRMAGCLDARTGDKTGRFVAWCDSLGIPLVFLVDVPGYLPGVGQEDDGVVRRGAKLLHAYAASTVPRLTVVLRKSYGGAFIAMGSKGLGADRVYAWPGAQVDVMGGTAAVEILHRRELAAATDVEHRGRLLAELAEHHAETTGGLQRAVADGAVDEVLDPAQTRTRLLADLAVLAERPVHRAGRRNPPQ